MSKERRIRRSFLATDEGVRKLIEAQVQTKYTQHQLAEDAGVSTDSVKNIFNPKLNRKVSGDIIISIADLLKLHPRDIVGSEWDPPEATKHNCIKCQEDSLQNPIHDPSFLPEVTPTSSAFDKEGQSSISTNIKNNASQTGTDLRGADLTDADLGQANLRRTIIDNTTINAEKYIQVREIFNQRAEGEDLSGEDLSDIGKATEGKDLSGEDLRGKDLSDTDLSDTDLSGANLRGANLRSANLRLANLRLANLRDAKLGDAKLGDANLRGANLQDADLSSADLSGADLSGADLSGAKLHGTQIDEKTKFDDKWLLVWKIVNRGAEGEDLSGKDLSDANLSDANLSHANLNHANLSRAKLRHANLRHANLRHANLSFADVSHAKLIRADLSFTIVKGIRFGVGEGLSENTNHYLKQQGAIFEYDHMPVVQPSSQRNSSRRSGSQAARGIRNSTSWIGSQDGKDSVGTISFIIIVVVVILSIGCFFGEKPRKVFKDAVKEAVKYILPNNSGPSGTRTTPNRGGSKPVR